MDVACPNCGNPNLDVDNANSVVYCKKCGFAVRVDPSTGETQVLNQGGGGGGGAPAAGGAPAEMGGGAMSGGRTILGMDPFMFWAVGTVVLLLLTLMQIIPDMTIFAVAEIILTLLWITKH